MRKTVGKWVYGSILAVCVFVMGYLAGMRTATPPQITVINPEHAPMAGEAISDTLLQDEKPLRINLNTADEETLDLLPGIGPAYAQRIVEYRAENGPFHTIEEIMLVSGIGENKFEAMKDLITVEDVP
jgi:comEA protein